VSSVCIPNYPDKNLPTIFVYHENVMKKQFVGPLAFGGMNLKQNGEYFSMFLYFLNDTSSYNAQIGVQSLQPY
jgi:hypothetical protein